MTSAKAIKRSGNFNPRSREGSDCKRLLQLLKFSISIHAPVKGATLFYLATKQ